MTPRPHTREGCWSPGRARLFSLIAGLALVASACAEDEQPDPETYKVLDQPVVMTSLPYLCGPYPEELLRGLSQQLVDEVNCIQPGVLAPFEVSQTPGSIYIQPNRSACNGQVPNPIPQYLRPEARDAAEGVAAQFNDFMTIRSGYRDVGMQYYDWYFGQIYGFAAARPGSSNHQAGRAIDVESHTFWRQKLIDYGWDWPYGTADAPHFEWPSANVPDLQVESVRAFQRLWNRNNPGDLIGEDGRWGAQSETRMEQTPAEGFFYGGCDTDTDGYGSPTIGGNDCDDDDPNVHPGAAEVCGDGVDQDCVGGDLVCGGDVGSDTNIADTSTPADTSGTDTAGSDTGAGDTASGQDTWTQGNDTIAAADGDASLADVPAGTDAARFTAWKSERYPEADVETACGCRVRGADTRSGFPSRGAWLLLAGVLIAASRRRRHPNDG